MKLSKITIKEYLTEKGIPFQESGKEIIPNVFLMIATETARAMTIIYILVPKQDNTIAKNAEKKETSSPSLNISVIRRQLHGKQTFLMPKSWRYAIRHYLHTSENILTDEDLQMPL